METGWKLKKGYDENCGSEPRFGGSKTIAENKHITALDGLRGAAALSVIAVHCDERGYIPDFYPFGGVLGVTIFFTLSGFLMAFLHGEQAFNGDTAWSYIVSRVARIAPLYLTVILFSWVVRQHVDSNFIYDINNHNLPRHLLFMGSERVFWSIPPEIQFYAFFLLMWFSLAAGRQGQYWSALLTGLVIVVMFAVAGRIPGTALPTKLAFFLGGPLAGLGSRSLQGRVVNARLIDTAQIVLLIAVPAYSARLFFITNMEETAYHSIPYAVLCAAMILAFSLPGRIGLSLFGNRAMQTVGAWSFALYLLHEPALYWGSGLQVALGLSVVWGLLLGAIFTAAMAIVAHYLIERPSRRWIKELGQELTPHWRRVKVCADGVK